MFPIAWLMVFLSSVAMLFVMAIAGSDNSGGLVSGGFAGCEKSPKEEWSW